MNNLNLQTRPGLIGVIFGLVSAFLYAALLNFGDPILSTTYFQHGFLVFFGYILIGIMLVLPLSAYKIGRIRLSNKPIWSVFRFSLSFIFIPLVIFYFLYFAVYGAPTDFAGFHFEGIGGFAFLFAPLIAIGIILASLIWGFLGYLDGSKGGKIYFRIALSLIIFSYLIFFIFSIIIPYLIDQSFRCRSVGEQRQICNIFIF